MANYTPPFVIKIIDTNQPHNNTWPELSKELIKDVKEVYGIDAELLSQAVNKYSETIKHFSILIDRSNTVDNPMGETNGIS